MHLTIATRGDRELVMTRSFDAPRDLVFRAFTDPELVRQWLLGPDGWTMPTCDIDLRPGGSYRYVWKNAKGKTMGMGGAFQEVFPPERLVSTEKFDDSWYPGEAVGTILLEEDSTGTTTLTQIMRYESSEALQAVLNSGMEGGVEVSFNRLASLLRG